MAGQRKGAAQLCGADCGDQQPDGYGNQRTSVLLFGQFGSTFSMEPSGSADLPILIQPNDLIPDMDEESFSLQSYLDQCEKSILEKILKKYKSTYKAAEILKISQPSVVRRKSKYHIDY